MTAQSTPLTLDLKPTALGTSYSLTLDLKPTAQSPKALNLQGLAPPPLYPRLYLPLPAVRASGPSGHRFSVHGQQRAGTSQHASRQADDGGEPEQAAAQRGVPGNQHSQHGVQSLVQPTGELPLVRNALPRTPHTYMHASATACCLLAHGTACLLIILSIIITTLPANSWHCLPAHRHYLHGTACSSSPTSSRHCYRHLIIRYIRWLTR